MHRNTGISLPESQDGRAPSERRRGGSLYFGATAFNQVAAVTRYVVIARMLGPQQLGLAATIVVTAAFFDLISDTGGDRFLIQDREGDLPAVQALVQLVYILRGLMVAAGLVALANPLAAFYEEPRLALGFQALAASRAISGFVHLDFRRSQRHHDYRPEATAIFVSSLAGLAATIAAAALTRDFMAVVYGLIVRAGASVLVSHLCARRPYQVAWSPGHGGRLARYSTPLMVAGLLLFASSQADRVIIVHRLGATSLGMYSAVLLLIYYPSAVILNYMHNLYMPLVAHGRDDAALRDRVGDDLGGQTLLLAIAMAAGFAIVAPFLVGFLFGPRFTQAALQVGLIGVLQATRFLMNWPTTVALSMGRSRTVMFSGFARLAVFPAALLGLRFVGGLLGVVIGFTVGEAIAIMVALHLLNRDAGRSLGSGFHRLALYFAVALLIVGWNLSMIQGSALEAVTMVAMTLFACVVVARTEWRTILGLIAVLRGAFRPTPGRVHP